MKKVLVAEDDAQLHGIYKMKLQSAGFDARVVSDGEEVLAAVGEFKPEVIVLDLLMPKKDGYQVLTELQANPEWKNIPVLVTSNLSQDVEMDKIKQMGAKDFLLKSDSSLDQMIEKINSM